MIKDVIMRDIEKEISIGHFLKIPLSGRDLAPRVNMRKIVRCSCQILMFNNSFVGMEISGMAQEIYHFAVGAEDQATAGRGAAALADILRDADGVVSATRGKINGDTMDLGTVVSVIATSGATLALAQGLAAWLRARRGVSVTVERKGKSESLKAVISGLDPDTALRIVEEVRRG
jgi:hypothetical protein